MAPAMLSMSVTKWPQKMAPFSAEGTYTLVGSSLCTSIKPSISAWEWVGGWLSGLVATQHFTR
jgi:hypothetical protein